MGGIIPNKEDGITPGILFAVSYPPGTSYDLSDPSGTTFGGLTERLGWRNQGNVVDFLKSTVQQMPEWLQATSDVFGGLRRGTPGNPVPLPLAIIEQFASQLLGIPPGTWDTVEQALAALENLPGISQIIQILTQISGPLTDPTSVLTLFSTNLKAFFGLIDFNNPSFDPVAAAEQFITTVLNPTGMLATASAIADALIPGLGGVGSLLDVSNWSADLRSLIGDPTGLGSGSMNPATVWANIITTFINPSGLLATGMDWLEIGLALFGISGLTQTGVSNAGSNMMSLLGNPNLNINPASFDPISMGRQLLSDVLSPAGALTSITEIPSALFGAHLPGADTNIAADPWFSNAANIALLPPWSYSTNAPAGAPAGAGSVQVAVNGSQQVMRGLPIRVAPAEMNIKDIVAGASVFWSSLTGAAGTVAQVAIDSYSDIDLNGNLVGAPIADPTRVVATILNPPANSAGTAGADANGFVPISGVYVPPAGTKYAQISLEILPAAGSSGIIGFSGNKFDAPNRLDAGMLGNIENIPQLLGTSIQGFQGLEDMVSTFQHLFDGMGTATSLTQQIGLGFNELFSFLQDLAQNADAGGSQGAINTNILGIRTNKSVGAGAHPTSEAMHHISLFGTGGTMTTTSLAAGNAMSQTFRASEVAQKGFFEFVAGGTGLTNIFTNIYSVNPTDGSKTKLWGSNDISGLIGTGLGYVKSLIPGASQPTVNAGQNLLLEIVNGGANPLTVATRNTGQPTHPTDFPKNLGATRVLASTGGNAPASLTDAQVAYTSNHPYVNLGMQAVPNNYVAPQLQKSGGNWTWTRPGGFVDGDIVDYFLLGSGGGGQSGGYGLSGAGGQAGRWQTGSFVLGSDPKGTGLPILPNSTTTLAVHCPTIGGGGGVNPYTLDPGRNGGASTISGAGITTITAAGGIGGGNGYNGSGTSGQEAGNRTIADYTAFGGPSTPVNANGPGEPGAGGSSGYPAFGNDGGYGYCWIRTRQAA